jgi:hypothetical protein
MAVFYHIYRFKSNRCIKKEGRRKKEEHWSFVVGRYLQETTRACGAPRINENRTRMNTDFHGFFLSRVHP